ncbi:hypothetical protein LshimejAT787_0112800 [Lyophyllum shimeji]|uniref:Protein kinase domain-containing protein n=1 Tax=Lyophyllum shimeji TaxID=47721 RepID=A0A9P3PF92_LYOSH|nr:hypothetical protein LshimejAT787_0112800 [Lyophyllum shimeji]
MSTENSSGIQTRAQKQAAEANLEQSVPAQEDLVSVNWFFFDREHETAPLVIRIPRLLFNGISQECRVLFKKALLHDVEFMAEPGSIRLYKPREPLLTDTAAEDGWPATISDFKSAFQVVPAPRSLAASLARLEDDDMIHLIVTAKGSYIPEQSVPAQSKKFSIWYRFFDIPKRQPDSVEIETNASITKLRDAIAARGLPDPRNPKEMLTHCYIEIWELDRRFELLAFDDVGWQHALAESGGDPEKIAVQVGTEGVDALRFKKNDAGEPFLTVIVSSVFRSSQAAAQAEAEEGVGRLATLYPRRYERLVNHQRSPSAKTPSAAANSASYRETQKDEFPIYDGRRPLDLGKNSSTTAMPPSLYHPVFQNWSSRASDQSFTPPRHVVASTAELMRRASILYTTEDDRKRALRGPLQNALLSEIKTVVNSDQMTLDYRISVQLTRGSIVRDVPVLIIEEKHEGTEATVDVTTQAAFSMVRAWSDPDLEEFRNLACCPTVLLGFSGCHLVISSAVLTDKCIVERLAMMWVGHSTTHDQNRTEDIARALYSLSLAFRELQQWYEAVIAAQRPLYNPNKPNHLRFFPHAHQYPLSGEDFTGDIVEFEYLYPLQKSSICVTFLARTKTDPGQESEQIVVKFVQRYCPDLHRLLATQRMAPALRYCGKIDESTPCRNWKMVVMDYFDGRPSYVDDAHLSRDVHEAVVKAVDLAHQEDFVFGDLRPPNVLINSEGDIKLIDFDWAGKEGEERDSAFQGGTHSEIMGSYTSWLASTEQAIKAASLMVLGLFCWYSNA